MENLKRFFGTIEPDPDKRVEKLTYRVVADRFHGELTVTDHQVQSGAQVTAHLPNTSEMLADAYHVIDESDAAVGRDVYPAHPPRRYEPATNRFFNFIGRGHETIAVPNVDHQDHTTPLVITGLSLTIIAKDDYDLLKISSNYGTENTSWETAYPEFPHPLNWVYTREFYMDGGVEGSEIVLDADARQATVDGVPQPLGVRFVDTGGEDMLQTPRQSFMVVAGGSYRIRIEFYKMVTEELKDEWGNIESRTYLKDVGIGFQGVAEITQYTLGGGRI